MMALTNLVIIPVLALLSPVFHVLFRVLSSQRITPGAAFQTAVAGMLAGIVLWLTGTYTPFGPIALTLLSLILLPAVLGLIISALADLRRKKTLHTRHSLLIFLGYFHLAEFPLHTGVILLLSRWFWEQPQNLMGHGCAQFLNAKGDISGVSFYRNAVAVTGEMPYASAISLGDYLIGELDGSGIYRLPGSFLEKFRRDILMHEYGHTFQSKRSGPLYLFKYGIPSALIHEWTERDADFRADVHRGKSGYRHVPFGGYPDDYRKVDPKWWEFLAFSLPVTLGLITWNSLLALLAWIYVAPAVAGLNLRLGR